MAIAVARGGVLPIPVESRAGLCARLGIPPDMPAREPLVLPFDDPSRALNPALATTHRDVGALAASLDPRGPLVRLASTR